MQYGFVVWDYVVFGANIILCLAIGFIYAFKNKNQTTDGYLLGNRQLKLVPVTLSFVVTFESSVLMLGYPAEMYIYGSLLAWVSVVIVFVCLMETRIIVPLFHPLKLTSVYKYLELRFKARGPRVMCTCLGALSTCFYMGVVLYAPALALEAVVGVPIWISILFTAAVAMTYTSMGGIKTVIWTDVVQAIVMFLGIIAITVQGTIEAGGVSSVWNRNMDNGRLVFSDFRADPSIRHTTWNIVIGGAVRYFVMFFNQATIQRISSLKTQKEAKRMLYIGAPIFGLTVLLVNIEGLVAYAYFNAQRCDPIKTKQISNPNQLIPYLVVRMFNHLPGMAGLFIAALYSASLSTLSSSLSGLSAQITEDFVKPYWKNLSEARTTLVAKLSVIVFGFIFIGIAFLIVNVKGSLTQIVISFTTAFSGPIAGIFAFAMFFPCATKQGAVIGGIISMIFTFWISVGQNFSGTFRKQPWLPFNPVDQCTTNTTVTSNAGLLSNINHTVQSPVVNVSFDSYLYHEKLNNYWNWQPEGLDRLYSLSYQWYALIGMLIVIVVGSVTSFITGRPSPEDIDARYMLPLGDTFFPFLPRRSRYFLNFRIDFDKRKYLLREEMITEGSQDLKLSLNETSKV